MTAFQYRMPSGIPGTVQRLESASIVADIILTTAPPTRYGDAVVLDAATSKVRPVTTGDAATAIWGALVRPYPTQGITWNAGSDPVNTTGTPGVPPTSGICNVLKRGFISVAVGGATLAAKNGAVYVRVANSPGAGQPIGGYEAAADGGNTIIMPHTYFMGPQDAQGNCEIGVFIGPQ